MGSGGAGASGTGGAGASSSSTSGSGGSGGAGPVGAVDWDARYDAALGPIPSDAKWVAMDGSDSNAGTETAPYLTIAKALENIAPGGQIVVKDGTYTGPENWINGQNVAIPNGISNEQRTIIRARNRLRVRITQTERPGGYTESIVYLGPTSSYIWIDGIIAETTWTAAAGDDNADVTVWDTGTHNRVTRVIVKKSSCSRYGGSFAYGNYAVFEDCHSIGSGRYQFYGGTGGDSTPSGSSVLRRCTSYMPFGPGLEPTASFAFYGSNDGSYALCKDVLFANCYEIDSPHIPHHAGGDEALKWGSWYHPKSVRNVRHIGCGSLDCGAEYAGFRMDNYGGDGDLLGTFEDCFVWSLGSGSPASAVAFGKADNGRVTVSSCSAGKLPGSAFVTSAGTTVTNPLFADSIATLTRREGGNGCEQLYVVGAFLSEYGEPGFDVVQGDTPLWPFPYEEELAQVASEIIAKPANDYPMSPGQSSNPYAGTALDGSPMTFTKRIWEATGNPMPDYASIYGA